MLIQLPYPHKILWPNGRTRSKRWLNAEFQKHKNWAYFAAHAALPVRYQNGGERIPIRLTVSGQARGPMPDKDGAGSACKAYLDGIALALGVNDSLFDPQPVHFSGRNSTFTIEIG